MKKKFVLILMLLSTFAFTQLAEAKRFGMGKSFGYSKQMKPKQYNQKQTPAQRPAANQPNKAAQTRPQSGASKWLGPLAGLAAGGLLAALLFGDGFEGLQIFDILLFALIAFILFKLFVGRRSQQSYAGYHRGGMDKPERENDVSAQYRESVQAYQPNSQGSLIGSGLSEEADHLSAAPEWFDQSAFMDGAKQHFVTVQKAWDKLDLNTLRDYCSPELFAAMPQEMAMMQPNENYTEVDTLDAELVDMAVEGEFFIASVRFSGFIKESVTGDAHAFNEIWHIRRLAAGEGDWQIAGIQQTDEA